MGEEHNDQILWRRGFQSWLYLYDALLASIKAIESGAGRPAPSILSSTQGAERHPQLVETKLRMMEMYMEKAQDQRLEMVKRKRADFETVKRAELNEIGNIYCRICGIMEGMEKALDGPKQTKQDEVADAWDEIAEEEGVPGNMGLQNLEGRRGAECAELRKFLASRSGEVRFAAAEALAHAKDTRSLVEYAYEEVLPENRKKILERILVAVKLGAAVGGKECSMLLKMIEDVDRECGEKALAISFRLFGRNLLNEVQVGYLLGKVSKEIVGDKDEKADLSKKARLWIRMACGKDVDEKERASLFSRAEEAVWMGARLGEAEVNSLAGILERLQGDAARQAWSLMMELLEKNQLGGEHISGIVLHADSIEDKNERKRIMNKMEERLRELGGLGTEAEKVLDAQRVSKVFLEIVADRPPARKSQPPSANGKKDSVPPQKA